MNGELSLPRYSTDKGKYTFMGAVRQGDKNVWVLLILYKISKRNAKYNYRRYDRRKKKSMARPQNSYKRQIKNRTRVKMFKDIK